MQADRPRGALRAIAAVLLVAAATLVALAGASELTARLLFRQSATSTMPCLVVTDASTGVRGRPGTACRQQIFESQLVDYRFNDCGYRTPQPCRPAPAGTFRIVLVGSSLAYGMHVAREESFAGRLGPLLSARLHRPVDLFNEAMQWGFPSATALHTADLLRPHPDMILWALTPFDIENAGSVLPYLPGVQTPVLIQPPGGAIAPQPARAPPGLVDRAWARLIADLSDTRAVFMLQHYLYRSQSQFLSHTLAQGATIDYLRRPTPPALRDQLAIFAQAFAAVAARARAAGVPLVVTLLPSRTQAIMLSNGHREPGYDPDQLARLVRPIVAAQGARYVDMTAGLAARPEAGQLYFSVDEHLPAAGHAMFADLLADALVRSGTIPPRRPGQPS